MSDNQTVPTPSTEIQRGKGALLATVITTILAIIAVWALIAMRPAV